MELRVVPTKVHGAVDYATAPVLLAVPALLRLDRRSASGLAPRIAGVATAASSALTDNDLALRRVLPMRAHLLLDAVTGAAVAATPWLFGSARRGTRHWLPHAVVGVAEVGLALTTRTRPRPRGVRRVWLVMRDAVERVPVTPAAAVAVSTGVVAVAAYAARRRLFQAAAVAADAVEEAADAVEDAAEDLAEAARKRAEQQ
jgi:hypothetical protein